MEFTASAWVVSGVERMELRQQRSLKYNLLAAAQRKTLNP